MPEINKEEFKKSINVPLDKVILLTVSRLVDWKKVDRSIRALSKIKDKEKYFLLIVGEGDERKNLESLIKELNLEDSVRLVGAVRNEDVYKYMTIADIFLSFYDLSNVGNPLLEALSLGKPIITYNVGDTIPEEKIESYFVWIPKYRYQLWDLGNYDSLTAIDESKVHEIPIIFGNYTTLDERERECTTPMLSWASGNCQVGDYMTHPAFLSIPSTGFWVGKFETGYDGATALTEAEQNVNDSSKVVIKPNTYSWRGIQVANAFYSSYNYQRNLDSHMMKNTEWGAVAFLQHSAYGSTTSVRINNNSDYVTGYQANNEPSCGITGNNEECNIYCNDSSCNTAYPNSVLSSTTGNITGIFDMSGNAWEYVVGVMEDENGSLMSGRNESENSGFNGSLYSGETKSDGYDFPNKKYYDVYSYSLSNTEYQRGILGDATGETGPFANRIYLDVTRQIGSWYTNYSRFVWSSNPWFLRGGDYPIGTYAGVFAFHQEQGRVGSNISFRVVLD